MDEHTLTQWIALSLIPQMGASALASLRDHFGTLDAILAASDEELRAVPGIGPKRAAAMLAIDLDQRRSEIAAWRAAGVTILTSTPEADYPPGLRLLADAPPVLFVRGIVSAALADAPTVAVVGARQPSLASREIAQTLARELAARGWIIVSGLAVGIDTAAHMGALKAEGRTLAVLGSGVNVIYPPENHRLVERILVQGAVLSEVHPKASPHAGALVARNRLISGLSRALIVVEAGERSGSLHAARFARAQSRAVYAVECDAAGNQALITNGARALDPADVDWDQFAAELAES